MTSSTKQLLLLIVVLGAMLVAAVWGAWDIWFHKGSDIDIGFHGTLAVILGAGASLVIGGGLMALIFFSSRRGYDDEVGR
jgi:hypothetical protein